MASLCPLDEDGKSHSLVMFPISPPPGESEGTRASVHAQFAVKRREQKDKSQTASEGNGQEGEKEGQEPKRRGQERSARDLALSPLAGRGSG